MRKKPYNQYSEFAREQELTAAVSFLSNKDLGKRYKHFLETCTIGYEVEVAKGELESEAGSTELSLDSLRIEFNNEFEWTETEYLQSLRLNTEETIQKFGLTAVHSFPDENYLNTMSLEFQNLSSLDYRVVGLPMQSGTILEEPSVDGEYDGFEEHVFKKDRSRIINIPLTIQKAENILENILKFRTKYTVISKTSYDIMDSKIFNTRLYIENLKEHLVNPEENSYDESEIRLRIYYIGANFYSYKRSVIEAIEKLSVQILKIGEVARNKWIIFDKSNRLIEIRTDFYSQKGILSDLISWPDNTKQEFIDDYEKEIVNEKERQWQQYIEDAQNRAEDDKDNIVETIHELVVNEVDPKAKLAEGYHQDQQYKGKYTVVESDSSIEPAGAEIVSPTFRGITASFKWLDDVFTLIEENGLETNSSTGFHVNIGTFESIAEDVSYEAGMKVYNHSIDVVKLAILSGDHYLLEQFGRFGNTYAKTMETNLRNLKDYNFDFKNMQKDGFMFLRKLNRSFIAGQHDRYRTINMQNLLDKNYLEFRIAGGRDYHIDREKVKKAIYRYVQLCAVACDPEAYFKDYMKALYQRFVDADFTIPSTKGPRPKNAKEAINYLRRWSSDQYTNGKEGLDREALKHLTRVVTLDAFENSVDKETSIVLDLISGLNAQHYKNVDNNILYSIRILMIYVAKTEPNPKAYLKDIYIKHGNKSIKDYIAPKLAKNKPQWIRYFYTGSFIDNTPKELITSMHIEADDYNTTDSYWITDEGKILTTTDHERTADKYAKDRKETAKVDAWCDKNDGTSVNYAAQIWGWIRIMGDARDNNIAVLIGENSVSPKAFTSFVGYLNDIPFEGCFIDVNKGKDSKSQQIKKVETLKSMVKKNVRKIKVTAMTPTKRFIFTKKPKPTVQPEKQRSNYESIEDATGLIPDIIADVIVREEILLRVLPERRKDGPALQKYLVERLIGVYDNNDSFKSKLKKSSGRDLAYAFMRHWASAYIKKNWSEAEQKKLGDAFANGKQITAIQIEASEDQTYTNKTKSVKVLYYANRSTPQVCKPGQTVKAKAGYGKRTKIRSATPDEVAQFKKGKWLRTREDGKAPNAKGSKTSKYRPQLAKKQRDARKHKLAASEGIQYRDFIKQVFGKTKSK